uniref:MARVEL domain-containing protein n=1 Tax=Sinocyclocheilus grahami TaxID=75366 RepID=A0A672PRD0_SINGR
MLHLDFRTLILPIGIVRTVEVVLTCICFALAASAGIPNTATSHWAWCMFCWCFCCFTTLLIIVLEFTNLNTKVPISWEDFTMAFAMLATLMMVTIAIIYPTFFACPSCSRQIGASAVSWLCFGLYAAEVWLVHKRPGETSGFLTTVPGLLKILETFVTCIIFTSSSPAEYKEVPGTQWCVAVYSICFVFSLLIIFLTIAKLASIFPFSFDKAVISFNILAVAMYATAVVIWPLYVFDGNPRPNNCNRCSWDDLVVVTIMTIINFFVYTGDLAYSVKIVFFTYHDDRISPADFRHAKR